MFLISTRACIFNTYQLLFAQIYRKFYNENTYNYLYYTFQKVRKLRYEPKNTFNNLKKVNLKLNFFKHKKIIEKYLYI